MQGIVEFRCVRQYQDCKVGLCQCGLGDYWSENIIGYNLDTASNPQDVLTEHDNILDLLSLICSRNTIVNDIANVSR